MKTAAIGLPVLAVLTGLLVTRCVAAGPTAHPAADHLPAQEVRATADTASGATADTAGSFNVTDVAWLQLMIPMTEQAVRLLELAPARSADPDVRRFAAEAGGDRRTTLHRLRELLRRAGVPESKEHDGHDMPGMVTAADFAVLNKASGASFDRLFRQDAREYLSQSVVVARGEQGSGADRETKAFAASMEKLHAAQLTRLRP
ncbi:DUF305 domain-containing protein [Sphaerisporangium sp. NBC_01403]|uniref:DUF305 domain-containing protein n=1 Tax=Sphaerisporangium sp. NBC_01403 TaxID=2903599 RepID=UPI003252762F